MMFEQERVRVVETCLDLADRGYLAGTGGNVAVRASDDHFLVTPSGTDYYTMGAEDICVIRLSDRAQVEGENIASVEAGLHANVFTARPDCGASVHTHQPIASAYSLLAIPLEVQDQGMAGVLGAKVPCVSYAPSGTAWLAKRVGRVFDAATQACLMRNHGVVCVGEDVDQAVARVAMLEAACARFFSGAQAQPVKLPAATKELVDSTLASIKPPQIQGITA